MMIVLKSFPMGLSILHKPKMKKNATISQTKSKKSEIQEIFQNQSKLEKKIIARAGARTLDR